MRYQAYLVARYRVLFAYSGMILSIIGVVFIFPVAVTPLLYLEEGPLIGAFLLTSALFIVTGRLLRRGFSPTGQVSLTLTEGMVIVTIVWLLTTLYCALPYMLVADLNFTQAIFESTSGLTTTGLSVIDVTTSPRILLFYRSFTQLVGGAGIAIIALIAIAGPTTSAGLSMAEGRAELLAPHIQYSTSLVIRIYIGYILIGIVALHLAGMNWFDAINHAFTAVATGGFSTRVESIGYWDSAAIEAVIIVLMLAGALNFLTAYTLLRGNFQAFVNNGEVRFETTVLTFSTIVLVLITTTQAYPTFGKSLRVALFESTSALSGTGFSTTTYQIWDDFGWIILIILMITGGGSGSTAGGLKQIRVYILYKALIWEFRRAFMPMHTVNEPAIWKGEQRAFLTNEQVRQTALFVFLYFITLFTGAAIIAAHDHTLGDSLFEFASSLGTVGLSVGVTQAGSPPTLLWTQIIGMLLGRLEFFALIIGFTKFVVDFREMALFKIKKQEKQ